jgi:glycosyltransferase involved in cell wall biosynthesis
MNIIGTGELEELLKNEVLQKNLSESVHFLGSMKPTEVRSNMERSDIYLFTSDFNEGWGAVLGEAMASGCAVICSNVGGMTNIVLDGYNGLIINPDEESLYNAIITLLYDHSLRSKLQFNAYNTVKEAFSLDIWRKKWAKVIKQTNNIL